MTGRQLANTDPALRRAWHPVARSTEVGGDPIAIKLLGEHWALVRLPVSGPGDGSAGETRLAAFLDRCPHRLAPLSAGHVDGDALRCGYHGWCFDAAGACAEIPALGTGPLPPRARAVVPAGLTERHGTVFLAPEPPLTELLDVPEADAPTFLHGLLDPVRARVGAGLMLDNFLDMAHFPYVHTATIGTAEAAVVHELEIERRDLGMTVRSRHPFPNHEDPGVASGLRPLIQERVLRYEYRAPFLASLRIEYVEAGGVNVVDLLVQPEDDEHCRLYASVHRNDLDGDEHRLAESVAYEAKILDEDLAIQERYRERSLPLELTEEVHIRADRATVELRRILGALVAAAD
ncbi:MAG: Rieske (2Fe-2S) domain protein [Actinomycetia bacterium]|nr:Rieske (2Fe-2S) domain protein [Actinomycetes bacterium]